MYLMDYMKYYEYIYDRQLIFHKKEVLKEKGPWTEDPILKNYHFCCVRREDDKGSKYLVKTITSNPDLSFKNKFFNIVAYRWFNVYGLFENIFDKPLDYETFDFKHYEEMLDSKKGGKLFNEAYLIIQYPFNASHRPKHKHVQILFRLEWLADQIKNKGFVERFLMFEDYKNQLDWLMEINGVGYFIAFQLLLDLEYTGELKHNGDDWVIMGPGAIFGVNWLIKSTTFKEKLDFTYMLRDDQDKNFKKLLEDKGKDWFAIRSKSNFYENPNLSICDIEHNLCELNKYLKLESYLNGNKRPRIRFYKGNKEK